MRVPQTTRAKVSRPRSSVPNGCARLGALRTSFQSVCIGSAPAIHGAPIAVATNSSTIAAPTTDAGRLRACRHARGRRLGSRGGACAWSAVDAVALGLRGGGGRAEGGGQGRGGSGGQRGGGAGGGWGGETTRAAGAGGRARGRPH